ncbi:MAG: hypothetical protein KAY24_01560 [Candidatus Eisenbacteria sp.]|nr:hypothetical protein [Candidatus Eisenbacteria bacterium]
MKKLLFCLALLGLAVGNSSADLANLENGVFIVHHEVQIEYSDDPPIDGWCIAYAPFAISSAEEQVNRIDTNTFLGVVWYVLAAWNEDKEWCATQFGLGNYDARVFAFSDFGACFPGIEGLEIPTAGWPGPNDGTAFVVTGDPWTGNYVPVYYFTGYAYGYYGGEVLQLTSDPSSGFGGWANCLAVPTPYAATGFGGLGINIDGTYAEPPSGQPGVCCIAGECFLYELQVDCLQAGGVFYPEWNSCVPNPCPAPEAACCIGETCMVLNAEDCSLASGVWLEGSNSCSPNPCELHVCCVEADCWLVREDECAALGGIWDPEGNTCEPNPCPLDPEGVCCVGIECSILLQSECIALGGEFIPSLHVCEPNPCSVGGPEAVCCVAGDCYILSQPDCNALGGQWFEELDSCDPNPCTVPTHRTSWGSIKALFRE